MELRVQLVAIAAALCLLLFVLELVRRRRLLERYALLWLFSGLSLLVLAVWKGLLQIVADAIGIFYPPSALFVIAFGFILVLLLHFSLAVSRLADQNRLLAQRLALLEQRLHRRERIPGVATGLAAAEDGGDDEAAVRASVVEHPGGRS